MAWILITLALLLLAYLLQAWSKKKLERRLPPGPKSIPVLGHLHLIGKNPHQDMQKLAEKHGPVMYLRFGFVRNIIVSSPQAAKQFLKIHDINFASRPPHEASKYISYDQRNLSFGAYGPYWRNMRKLCTLELLSSVKINTFKAMRKEELGLLVDSIQDAAREGVAVDLSDKVASMSADISCRMIFGKKYVDNEIDEKGFKVVIQEGMQLAALPNLGNFFPYLSVLDLQGLTKRMVAVAKVFDKFLEKILDEHAIPKDPGQTKDFVDTMLDIMKSGGAEFEFDRTHIKAVLLDMLLAAVDTAATTVDWTMSELLKNPQIMKKVQNELAEVVGIDKMVDESDLASLEYLDMPSELDMTEEFGLVVTRADHLKAIPSCRLHLN
ncbi:Flavonoid 3-hydroxylase [Heracleum sosnowskyi]|uniref:Flavonoid 3-hydroxylase n=1 Tax=Heracleum sosnowskyi TaxID=360622 RepID=A0AAD8HRR6_9APIA|nr:Flavonoid 3-hydroxylase [Heracleum sosnowskyi]